VFILYSIPIGLLIGFVIGGRLGGLAAVQFHWAWLAIAGLAVQILIFSDPIGSLVGDAGPAIYVASTAAVLVAVIRNIRIPGIAIVALGAGCNLAAIIANGGHMPADPAALAAVGITLDGITNSVVVPDPVLRPLTDIFALPAALPFANVFSVGDVLIGIGIAATIALAMRRGRNPDAGRAGAPRW
jgi:Family of unknown function (DUF5317)